MEGVAFTPEIPDDLFRIKRKHNPSIIQSNMIGHVIEPLIGII
jgi:hypothetical protein